MIVLDGATGTELARYGVDIDRLGWTAAAIVEHAAALEAVHRSYVAAGVGVITANTFRTHARNTQPLGLGAADLTSRAVAIARRATAGTPVAVWGSAAPLADCYDAAAAPDEPTMRREHDRHAANLAAAGVDGVLVETMTTIAEAAIATKAAAACGLPVTASVAIRPDGLLYSGERLADAITSLEAAAAARTAANCFPASIGCSLADVFNATATQPWGLYANTGRLNADGTWSNEAATDPETYSAHAAEWIAAGASLVGGCCGTTPEHIRLLTLTSAQKDQ